MRRGAFPKPETLQVLAKHLQSLRFVVQTHEPRHLNLSEEDKAALEAFLRTLTDEFVLHDEKFSDPFE